MFEHLLEWDQELFIYLNSIGSPSTDAFWIFVTKIEHWIPFYIFLFLIFIKAYPRKKAFKAIGFTVLTFVISYGLTFVVKQLVSRARPSETPEIVEVARILQTPFGYSFFSGHAAVSFAMITFVVLTLKHRFKWIGILFIWPLLFICSRIYVGVHYPLDILTGTLVGVTVGVFCYRFLSKRFL